jgi:hypothetical protein
MTPRLVTIWPSARLALIAAPLIYACSMAVFAQTGFPTSLRQTDFWPFLADNPVGEDGYYMLTVAWNLATKGLFAYNGDIETTGVQPLAVAIYAVLAKLALALGGTKDSFVRVVVAFQALLFVAWAIVVGRTCEQASSRPERTDVQPTALDFAVMPALAFPAFRWFIYGLETGLYLLVFTIFLNFVLRHENELASRPLRLGLFGGLACLTRIDFTIVLGVALAIASARKKVRPTQLLQAAAVIVLMLLPWIAYCYLVSGVPWPSSAGAQSELLTLGNARGRIIAAVVALMEQGVPWVAASARPEMAVAALLVALIAVLYLSLTRRWASLVMPLARWPISTFGIALVALAGLYVATIWAAHFYSRYFILLSVITYICVAATLRTPREAAALGAVCLALFVSQSYLAFHSGRIGNSHSMAAGAIDRYFPREVRIGMFQSGVTGFYHPNVINLDGKLDHEALDKLRKGRILDYIKEKRIVAVCDWPGYLGDKGMDQIKNSEFNQAQFALTPLHVCYVSDNSVITER